MNGPLGSIRKRFARRLSAMIDWRVRKAFEDERAIILDTNETVGEISSILSDKISVLEASIIELHQQIELLKRESR